MEHPRLLHEFFARDCDNYVATLLGDEISKHWKKSAEVRLEFEFNTFNIALDFKRKIVEVEDDLDSSPEGSCRVSLEEFVKGLRGYWARTR